MKQFIRAGMNWRRGAFSIPEAKALALLEVMQTTYNMNLENIIFESDAQAQVVAGAIHVNHVGVSVFSILKKLLILNQNFEVNFVKCEVNSVAYKLYRMVNF
jgi:hypothetical protein